MFALSIVTGCIGAKPSDAKTVFRESIEVRATPILGVAVDTDGNAISDETALGDIDMAETTVGDFKGVIAPNYNVVSNAAVNAATKESVDRLRDNIDIVASSATNYTDSAIAELAPLASPVFTGTPSAPTPASGDNSTKIATTEFVQAAVAGGGGGTPLSGQTFNFATTQGVMDALKITIEMLGGTVTNAPSLTISQGE